MYFFNMTGINVSAQQLSITKVSTTENFKKFYNIGKNI